MLKGIPAIIPPELMKILMEMGHGDELLICDGNYPKFGCPERCVRMDGHGTREIRTSRRSGIPTGRSGRSMKKTACGKSRCRNPSSIPAGPNATPVSRLRNQRCMRTSF